MGITNGNNETIPLAKLAKLSAIPPDLVVPVAVWLVSVVALFSV